MAVEVYVRVWVAAGTNPNQLLNDIKGKWTTLPRIGAHIVDHNRATADSFRILVGFCGGRNGTKDDVQQFVDDLNGMPGVARTEEVWNLQAVN